MLSQALVGDNTVIPGVGWDNKIVGDDMEITFVVVVLFGFVLQNTVINLLNNQ